MSFISSKAPESYLYDEAFVVDWRAKYAFPEDPGERSSVEEWSSGDVVEGFAAWRQSGLAD